MELSEVMTGIKVPRLFGMQMEMEIPYVSVVYELENMGKGLVHVRLRSLRE